MMPPPERTVFALTESLDFGGAERILGTMLVGLANAGWHPVLLHPDEPEGLAPLLEMVSESGISTRIVPVFPEGVRGGMRSRALVRLLRSERPAVFHAHQTWPLGCKWALAAACAARTSAVVATTHASFDVPMDLSRHTQVFLLSRAVDRVIAVSEHTRREYARILGWPLDRIGVVRNGLPVQKPSDPAGIEAARASLGASGPVALVPARLAEEKGHRYLLEAARSLPEVTFACVGDGMLRGELTALAEKLGVHDRVRFLGFRRDVPALLRASDLVVMPSLTEGLSLALIEAMLAGRPVVATNVGGTPELVAEGITGLLVPPRDPEAIAAAIRLLTSDHDRAEGLGAAGRERARRDFSMEAMVEGTTAEYQRALRGDSPAR